MPALTPTPDQTLRVAVPTFVALLRGTHVWKGQTLNQGYDLPVHGGAPLKVFHQGNANESKSPHVTRTEGLPQQAD